MDKKNNFTFLRVIAALLVVFGHAFTLKHQSITSVPVFLNWTPINALGLYIFFSISGYLIIKSWYREPKINIFILKRLLRIIPGLSVVVILSIIILGPIVTSLSVDKYFMSRDTWLYLSNIFLYARFSLPGVFTDNFYPNVVNGSLWSLTIEFIMYLLLLVLAIYSKNTKYLFILITLVFCIIRVTIIDKIDRNIVVYGADIRQIFICGVYFMVGICFERYRIDKYFNIYSFCIIFIVWYSLSNFQNLFFIASFFCLPFLCLAFGASNWLLLSIFSKNDYSYGIYIYAFPIQQLVSYYFDGISFISYLLLTICIIIIFAVLSWHLVEKPFLLLKQRLLI